MRDKLMEKLSKKGKKLNPLDKKAKLDVVKSLSSQAGAMLGDKVKAMKEKPEKAMQDMFAAKASSLPDPEKSDEEESGVEIAVEIQSEDEGAEEEKSDDMMEAMEDCSPEEIEEKIQKLQELKKEKLAKKE